MTIDILDADPEPEVWQRICSIAEGAPAELLARLAGRLRDWPAHLRPMPDRWWEQRRSGRARPWHALATHRRLCELGDYFYPSAVACPSDLSLLLIGSGATGNNDLGEVILWRPYREAEIDRGDDYDDEEEVEELTVATLAGDSEAVDACFSPDGRHAVVGFSEHARVDGPAVYAVDGREIFTHALAAGAGDSTFGDSALGDSALGDSALGDFAFVRVDHCAGGRLFAAGRTDGGLVVAEPSSGKVLLEAGGTTDKVLEAGGTTGPVALDGGGNRVAYACPGGRIGLRDVASGALVSTFDTGLEIVNAIAFSPDGDWLAVAGGGGDRPTACLLDLYNRSVLPASADGTLDSGSPFAGFATRARWTRRGPLVFASDDSLAVLFNGRDGRTLWSSAEGQVVGSFTPDGRVLVASGPHGTVDAWFLDAL